MPHLPLPHSPPLSTSPPSTFKQHRPHLAPLQLSSFASPRTQHTGGRSLHINFQQTSTGAGGRGGARRAMSQEELVAREGEVGDSDERVEAWRTGVWTPLEDVNHSHHDEGGGAAAWLDSAPFSPSSPSSAPPSAFSPAPPFPSPPIIGPAIDAQDESFLSLAALHDPSLFGHEEGGLSSPLPPLHPDEEQPESPTGLEVDFSRGRGRRAQYERDRTAREASAARSLVSSVGMTRKLLSSSGGMKGEASVQVQAKAIASSPPAVASPQVGPLSARSSTSLDQSSLRKARHIRGGSTASDQLLRLQSNSPSSALSLSPPSSPHKRVPLRPATKRRYSSAVAPSANEFDDKHHSPTSPSLIRAKSQHHPPFRYGSVAALSKYLDQGRRSSLPSTPKHADSAPETPAEPRNISSSGAAGEEGGVDPTSSFFGSLTTHLPSLPSFNIPHPHLGGFNQNCPSPSPAPSPSLGGLPQPAALAAEAPSSPLTTTQQQQYQVSWTSIRALNVRFRPGGFGSGMTTSTDTSSFSSTAAATSTDSSLGLNHFVLGLQDLALGGKRSWDPRLLLQPSAFPDGGEEEKGAWTWPTIRTEVGGPPRVEVVYQGGGRRVCEVGGMGAEEIMRAVLSIPV